MDGYGPPEDRIPGRTGLYGFVEGTLLREAGDRTQGLGAFLRVGAATARPALVPRHAGAGLVYTGLLPGRPADAVGVAWSRADLEPPAGPARTETVVEFTYRATLGAHVVIQPIVKWVSGAPLGDPKVRDGVALGLRLGLMP